MAPTYTMRVPVDVLDASGATLGQDLRRFLVARALDASTSTSTVDVPSPTSSSNLSHTTSPSAAETDMVTIAMEKVKPWLLPMALIVVGFTVLVFLCCCVRWGRLAEMRKDRTARKQTKQESGKSLNVEVEKCLSKKTSFVSDSSQSSKDDVKKSKFDVENAKSKPILVIDTNMTHKQEQTDDVPAFEEYVTREVGRITTPSTTTTSAFTEIVETEGDHVHAYLGENLRTPTCSTRSSSPSPSVQSVSEQRRSGRSSVTLSIPVTSVLPLATEEGDEVTSAHLDIAVNVVTGQSATQVISEEVVITETTEESVGIAITTEEAVTIVGTAQAFQNPGMTAPSSEDICASSAFSELSEDTPVKSQRLIIYPQLGSTIPMNPSEADKVYNSRTLVLSAL